MLLSLGNLFCSSRYFEQMVKINSLDKIEIIILSILDISAGVETLIVQVYRYCIFTVMTVEILMPQEGLLSQIFGHTSFPLKLLSPAPILLTQLNKTETLALVSKVPTAVGVQCVLNLGHARNDVRSL